MVDALTALGRKQEATVLLDEFAQAFPTIKGVTEKRNSINPPTPPTPAKKTQ